jgi:hypothetical protein
LLTFESAKVLLSSNNDSNGTILNSFNSEAIGFSKRLIKAVEENGIKASATVVARNFNIYANNGKSLTPHAARNWLLGNSMPRQEHLRVLSNWLKVSPDHLRFGKSQANTLLFQSDGVEHEVSFEDQQFLAKYFSLSDAQKSVVRSVANYPSDS